VSQVARYGKMVAKEGRGEDAATLLLDAAAELRSDPGCELYLVNRQAGEPDVIWVTELWRSQEDLDEAGERIRGSDEVGAVMELVADAEMIELDLLGGKGAREPAGASQDAGGVSDHTIVSLTDAEDLAARFGYSDRQEARFPNEELGVSQTGLAHLRLKPNQRQPFAHRHNRAEEVYLVLSGSGRVKVGDELAEVEALDAVRVSPRTIRAFEAGPEGLELLAFSARHPGDAEMVADWWPD